MAKWYGKVGYVKPVEIISGMWEPKPIEVPYSGDLLRVTSRWSTSDKVNEDVSMSNQISVVADPFAFENFSFIKYVEFMGTMWEVTSIDVQYPRLVLTVGGVWNGEQATIAE